MLIVSCLAQIPEKIGQISVMGDEDTIQLRIIDTLDAISSGNGVLMINLPDGNIGAADLVDTTNIDASEIFINTIYGIKSWRKVMQGGFVIVYGGAGDDWGSQVTETSDGNYLVSGITKSFGAGYADLFLTEFDRSGEMVFSKAVGGLGNDGFTTDPQLGSFARKTMDGGYVMVSHSRTIGSDNRDVIVVKLDSTLERQWSKTIGGSMAEEIRYLIETDDGSIVTCGWTWSYPESTENIMILKIDEDGDLERARLLTTPYRDPGEMILQAHDGGFFVTGWTTAIPSDGYSRMFLVKLDSDLNIEWAKGYGEGTSNPAYSMAVMPDGGVAIMGYSAGYGAISYEAMIVRTDHLGNPVWSALIGNDASDFGYSIKAADDSSLVIVVKNDIPERMYACKISDSPAILWARAFPDFINSWIYGFDFTNDGYLLLTGSTTAYTGESQSVLIKMNYGDGYCCYGEEIDLTLTPISVSALDYEVEAIDLDEELADRYLFNSNCSPEILKLCD
ncbi:MAG: hypothetical protein ACLFSQ_05205 [Candidatus Zixiibacteriota bacterium]